MLKFLFVVAVMAVSLLPGPRADAVERDGLFYGLSGGFGRITCDGCDSLSGFGFDFHTGYPLSGELALVAEGYGVAHPEKGATLTNFILAGAVQYWPGDRFWVKGGVGAGQLDVSDGNSRLVSDTALAMMAAAGYEVVQRGTFTVDLQGRFGNTRFDGGAVNMMSAHVGVNWY